MPSRTRRRMRGTSGRCHRFPLIATKQSIARLMALWGLLAFSVLGWAESSGSVRGWVFDPQQESVPGATVRLYARNSSLLLQATTQEDGAYRFANVAPGEYLVEAEAPNFVLATTANVRVNAGGEQVIDIRLEISSVRTQVVVTASSTPLSLEEVSKALDVVGADQMRDRVEFSITEAIRNVPGVRVQQLAGPGSLTKVRMRGLRSQDTSVLIDGLRFRDATSTQGDATAFTQDLMIVDTERVEMLRGSGSSLYGTHAMGGVMNIKTRQGGGPPHGEISAEGGGLGMFRGVARVGGGLAEDRFVYSGGVSHLNVTRGVDRFDPYRNTSGQGFARYNFTPSISLSGRFFAADAFGASNETPIVDEAVAGNHPESGPVPAIGLPENQLRRFENNQPYDPGNATFIPAFNDPDNHRASSFFAGAVFFTHELTPNNSYRVSYHGISTDRSFRDGPAGRNAFDPTFSSDSGFDGRIDTLQARTDHRLGEYNLVTVGYEYEREEYRNLNTDENPDPAFQTHDGSAVDQSSHTAFAQDQIRLHDGRLQMSLSGRVQSFDLSSPEFVGGTTPYDGRTFESPDTAYTGDASLAYFFRSKGTKLRAHVGNAYRSPSAFERFGASFFFGSFSVWGDPGLRPERSLSFDAGFDQWFADSRLRISATYFYTSLQEIIVFDFGVIDPVTDPFGRSGGYRNTGGGLARGVEFSVSAAPTRSLNFIASYTYTNSDSRTETVPGQNFFKMLSISDHMFTLTATQRIGRRFAITVDLFAASGYPFRFFGSPRLFDVRGPVKTDVVGSYTHPLGEGKSMRIYGKLENAFNKTYWEDGFTAPGTWGIGGVAFNF